MLFPSPNFFRTKRSLAELKAELLPAYFQVWAETQPSEELILADLHAANGFELNGEKATALQIQESFAAAENATENEGKTLKLFLSDASKTNLEKLKQSLQNPEEETLQLPENIYFLNERENLETLLEQLQKVPGLVVADPFSYELAQEITAETQNANARADLFLLFDYKKLEKTFSAETGSVLLPQLFGAALPEIQTKVQLQKSPKVKEQFLLAQLEKAFREQKFYPLLFKINPPGKTGNAIYLMLASRCQKTYFGAKEWLQTFSEFQEDGVPLFGVNLNYQPAAIPGFSDFLNKFSLLNLTQELAQKKSDFHYQTVQAVYENHSVGTPYILANYLKAFQKLSAAGKVNLVDANNKKVTKLTPQAVVFYRLHSK